MATLPNLADHECLLARFTQNTDRALCVACRYVNGHADSAIEHAIHFRIGDVALLLQPCKYRFAAPGAALQHDFQSVRQYPRNVIDEAAARDVRQAMQRHLAHQLQQRFDVNPRRRHETIDEADALQIGLKVCIGELQNFANQGKTVGMRTGGGQPQYHIAGARFRAIDDGVFLHHTDTETREVVIRTVIHAGHLGGFSADQGTAGLHAPLDDARNDSFADVDIELAA